MEEDATRRCAGPGIAAMGAAAAGSFAAMTAAHPVASRSPDGTGVCCAGRSVPLQCEMVTGPGFSSPNQPDQERTTAYRDSSGPDSRSDAHCATIVGDWEEPSGEPRLKNLASRTRVLGRLVGRSIPIIGAGLLLLDAAQIGICTARCTGGQCPIS